jgi:hypothetical protein
MIGGAIETMLTGGRGRVGLNRLTSGIGEAVDKLHEACAVDNPYFAWAVGVITTGLQNGAMNRPRRVYDDAEKAGGTGGIVDELGVFVGVDVTVAKFVINDMENAGVFVACDEIGRPPVLSGVHFRHVHALLNRP